MTTSKPLTASLPLVWLIHIILLATLASWAASYTHQIILDRAITYSYLLLLLEQDALQPPILGFHEKSSHLAILTSRRASFVFRLGALVDLFYASASGSCLT